MASTFTITPDHTPPALTLVSPADGSRLTTNLPQISLQYGDSQSGINLPTLKIYLDNVEITSQTVLYSSSASYQPSAGLSEGSHNAAAGVMDHVGNFSIVSSTFIVDTVAPSVQVSLSPQSPVKSGIIGVMVTGSEQLSLSQIGFQMNGSTLTTPVPLASANGVVWTGSFTVNSGMDGQANWVWNGTDLAGNNGSAITSGGTFIIDTIPPSASIAISPQSPLPPGMVSVTLTASEPLSGAPLTYTVRNKAPVSVALSGSGNTWTGSFNVTPQDGANTAQFDWTGTDLAGNVGNMLGGAKNFEVDAIPPIGSFVISSNVNYATSTAVTLSFNAVDFTADGRVLPTTMLISLDRGLNYTEEPFSAMKQLTLPEGGYALRNGRGVFKQIFVKFKDAVGNVSPPVQNGIVIDTSSAPRSVLILRKRN